MINFVEMDFSVTLKTAYDLVQELPKKRAGGRKQKEKVIMYTECQENLKDNMDYGVLVA